MHAQDGATVVKDKAKSASPKKNNFIEVLYKKRTEQEQLAKLYKKRAKSSMTKNEQLTLQQMIQLKN